MTQIRRIASHKRIFWVIISGILGMGTGDTTILVKNFSTSILLKSAPTRPRGWTVYRKNKNNFVESFKMGGNRQNCRKLSRLNRFLNLQESIDQYLMHVNISKFSNFHQFFQFFHWLPTPPIFSTGDIIRYI